MEEITALVPDAMSTQNRREELRKKLAEQEFILRHTSNAIGELVNNGRLYRNWAVKFKEQKEADAIKRQKRDICNVFNEYSYEGPKEIPEFVLEGEEVVKGGEEGEGEEGEREGEVEGEGEVEEEGEEEGEEEIIEPIAAQSPMKTPPAPTNELDVNWRDELSRFIFSLRDNFKVLTQIPVKEGTPILDESITLSSILSSIDVLSPHGR